MNSQFVSILVSIGVVGAGGARAFSPLGTAISYQGRLLDASGPVNGYYDISFALQDAAVAGTHIVTVTNFDVPVSNGLFTTSIDFGSGIFIGYALWVEIGVRTNSASGAFATLSPRQPLAAAPNAQFAYLAANVPNGSIGSSQLGANSVSSFAIQNGAVTTAAIADGTITPADLNVSTFGTTFWGISGNAGTTAGAQFIGTTDNQPLEIHVNNTRAFRIEPTSVPSIEGGYFQNSTHGFTSAAIVGGGTSGSINEVFGNYGFIGAGHGAKAGSFSAVVDGAYNDATGLFSFVGDGQANTNRANYAFIGAGTNNSILTNSDYSFIGSGQANRIQTGSAFSVIAGGAQNLIGLNSGAASILGGTFNFIQDGAGSSIISGGDHNLVQGGSYYSTIAGGSFNFVLPNARFAVIGGGVNNTASGVLATVAGGGNDGAIPAGNVASGNYSTVSGGGGFGVSDANQASGDYSIVSGGIGNQATNAAATVAGGAYNLASGQNSFVAGGDLNVAGGMNSFAAGQQAQALHQGSFVWADSQNAAFASTSSNQFCVRAQGGVGINTNHPGAALDVNGTARVEGANNWDVTGTEGDFRVGNNTQRFKIGVATAGGGAGDVWMRAQGGTQRVFLKTPGGTTIYTDEAQLNGVTLAAGGGAWTTVSDRNAKEHFAPVNGREILQKVASLPISTWNYKAQDAAFRHLGPMAQDFKAAFDLGESDRGITTVDEEGVALAAIQGLNEKVEVGSQRSEDRIQKLEEENAELRARLGTLEKAILQRNQN